MADDPTQQAQDPEAEAPVRLMTPAFFMALSFGLACVLAGLALAFIAPRVLAVKAHDAAAARATAASDASPPALRARIAELERELAVARAHACPPGLGKPQRSR